MRRVVCYQGRVQGVGFRATACACARGLAVTGFVRNEPDGSVRLEAQGTPEVVEALLARIRDRMGRLIAREDATELPEVEGESAFVIAR